MPLGNALILRFDTSDSVTNLFGIVPVALPDGDSPKLPNPLRSRALPGYQFHAYLLRPTGVPERVFSCRLTAGH